MGSTCIQTSFVSELGPLLGGVGTPVAGSTVRWDCILEAATTDSNDGYHLLSKSKGQRRDPFKSMVKDT